MNTNLVLGIVAAVVVVGLGAFYFMGRPAPAASEPAAVETQSQAEAGKFEGTFSQMAARQGSWRCTLDSATAQSISSGVAYVSGGKVRSDFSSTIPGYGTVEGHMLADGEYVYSWSSAMPEGFKMPQAQGQASASVQTSGGSVDANAAYSYDCQPWTAEASRFEVPTNVTFRAL